MIHTDRFFAENITDARPFWKFIYSGEQCHTCLVRASFSEGDEALRATTEFSVAEWASEGLCTCERCRSTKLLWRRRESDLDHLKKWTSSTPKAQLHSEITTYFTTKYGLDRVKQPLFAGQSYYRWLQFTNCSYYLPSNILFVVCLERISPHVSYSLKEIKHCLLLMEIVFLDSWNLAIFSSSIVSCSKFAKKDSSISGSVATSVRFNVDDSSVHIFTSVIFDFTNFEAGSSGLHGFSV